MNQAQMIDEIAAHTANDGIAKTAVKTVLDALAKVAQTELQKGGEVTLPGIGKLSSDLRAARTGRNPKTGEAIAIAEKRVPKFSAAKAFKDAVALSNG